MNSFIAALPIILIMMVTPQWAQGKDVVGWVEKVTVHPGNIQVKAKIDSGAKTSSLHCDCIQVEDRDGEQWVSFVVTNFKEEQIRLERKVERIATIKRHFGEAQERMVVKLGVCLGNVYKEVEVNVIDRSGLNYPMLIGRNFLAGEFLIDPDSTFVTEPSCMIEAADE